MDMFFRERLLIFPFMRKPCERVLRFLIENILKMSIDGSLDILPHIDKLSEHQNSENSLYQ